VSEHCPIDISDYAKIETPVSFGRPPKLEWLSIKQLCVDPRYQRDVVRESRTNIRRIAQQFNWAMFGTVVVASVGGNRYAIIDGQHRTTAAALCGLDRVPCQVIEATLVEQAAAFRAINGNVTKLSSIQIHHAAVAAGDADAIEIAKCAANAGCTVLRYPKPWNEIGPGETMAVKALGRTIKRFGADVTTCALRAIRETGDGNTGMLRAQIIFGAAEVLADHPEWRKSERLKDAFEEFDIESAFDNARVRGARLRGSSTTDQFEALLVEHLAAFFGRRKGAAA
jgi:hypothetical protein